MVAAVRALTGESPEAYVGDSAVPDTVKTRTLQEETHRVFRARVVNPKWIAAMQRHGYKGAFEMAATVDYLFGYDATAGVVEDWMYEKLASSYVFDETNAAFMRRATLGAARRRERLLEAADRGLWAEPSGETIEQLKRTYLELEGDLEGSSAGSGSRAGRGARARALELAAAQLHCRLPEGERALRCRRARSAGSPCCCARCRPRSSRRRRRRARRGRRAGASRAAPSLGRCRRWRAPGARGRP
jgi:cobalamin biosynthesis Mg chelatase CobN